MNKVRSVAIKGIVDVDRLLGVDSELIEVDQVTVTPILGKESEAFDLESKLMNQIDACGCEAGAIGLVVGVGAFILWLLIRPTAAWPQSFLEITVSLVVLAVALGIVGKGIGLAMSRIKVRRTLGEIRSYYARYHLRKEQS